MHKRLSQFVAAVVIAVVASGCTQSGSTTRQASRPSGGKLPKRIVSLTPSNTEILFALGLEDRVVGVTSRCNYPPEARKKAKVGDMNISIERVVALKPDLVLAHSVLNDKVIHRLQDLNIPVLAVDPKDFSETLETIRRVGRETGTSDRAEEITRSMEAAAKSAGKRVAGRKPPKVLFVVQSSPIWAAGPKTLADDLIRFAGAESISADGTPGKFSQFPTETAIARNPDVIVVTYPGDKTFFVQSSVWRNTSAVKNGRIVAIDPDIVVRPGPRLAKGIKKLTDVVNGSDH